jgi:hypothetical protein
MNINELKEQVAAAQELNAKKVAEAAAIAGLEAILALESSETLFEAKVKLAATAIGSTKLQKLVDECAAIVANIPVTNTKTRTTRVWAGSRRFAFGNQVNLAYQLATGILYSCAEHKPLLLAHTGLDAELLDQVIEAFGTPAYYSRNYNSLVVAKSYNVVKAKDAMAIVQSQLGTIIDTSLVTSSTFSLEFGKSEKTAYTDKLKADEAIEELELEM